MAEIKGIQRTISAYAIVALYAGCKKILKWQLGLHVLLPIMIGAFIYVVWRSTGLWWFIWAKTVSLENEVTFIRTIFAPIRNYLSHWILYSLPDALWVYAATAYMLLIWSKRKNYEKYIWLFVGPCLGVGSELAQLAGKVPGTFDLCDLTMLIIASILPFILLSRKEKTCGNTTTLNQLLL